MATWLLIATLALLVGVPSLIAGWLACGFSDLRRQLENSRSVRAKNE